MTAVFFIVIRLEDTLSISYFRANHELDCFIIFFLLLCIVFITYLYYIKDICII